MDEWDNLLDPYQESIQQGKQEGREAGLKTGFKDGHSLGKIKGLEIGIELGYMESVVTDRLEEQLLLLKDRPTSSGGELDGFLLLLQRRIKRLTDFLDLVQSFPTPDIMFANANANATSRSSTTASSTHVHVHGHGHGHNEDTSTHETESETESETENSNGLDINMDTSTSTSITSPIDIVEQMQRIRAKFKTILVQIKMPHFTLKKVMNDASHSISLADHQRERGGGAEGFVAIEGGERILIPSAPSVSRSLNTSEAARTAATGTIASANPQIPRDAAYQDNEW